MSSYALIMAGGGGTRLWPLSRRGTPKQTLPLVRRKTMFEHAVERLFPLFQPSEIFVVAAAHLVEPLRAVAPGLPLANFIVEPEGRGTAPCIGLAAIHLLNRDPNAIMAVLTADHYIAETADFRMALRAACQTASRGHLVTLGIKPDFPATGYGYIRQGTQTSVAEGLPVFQVLRFTEKPDRDAAIQMAESGEYSWNSGMFVWRADRIIEEFARQMPVFHGQLARLQEALGTACYQPTLRQVWKDVAKQTIDYGIMEGADDVVVLPVDIGWSDVGSWTSVAALMPKDARGNSLAGQVVSLDTHDTLVFGSKRLVATIGLTDMIIVDTEDALLVCPKHREQEVRKIVERLKQERRDEFL
jgi:mannose-1-phosphate guanylyltransferase